MSFGLSSNKRSGKKRPLTDVIDLLHSDSDSDHEIKNTEPTKIESVGIDRKGNGKITIEDASAYRKIQAETRPGKTLAMIKPRTNANGIAKAKAKVNTTISHGLQAGLVLEEDIFAAVSKDDGGGNRKAPPNVLFEDPEFGPVASSIQGVHKVSITDVGSVANSVSVSVPVSNGSNKSQKAEKWRPKCRCNLLAVLSYRNKDGRPYFSCGKHASFNITAKKGKKCNFFAVAFKAELVPWYRFGSHNGQVLVRKDNAGDTLGNNSALSLSSSSSPLSPSIFSAQDLVQGKVGDCWFMSALAVVAERSDLIKRLFQRRPCQLQNQLEDEHRGIVRVNLFLDGIWSQVTIDNFLPCCPGGDTSKKEEEDLRKAIEASLLDPSATNTTSNNNNNSNNNNDATTLRNPYAKPKKPPNANNTDFPPPASGNDPNGLSETNLRAMRVTANFLEKDCRRRKLTGQCWQPTFLKKGAIAETRDLAYAKARRNQLWVPFLEKAYAKIHGSYQAISGGHVAEAFLDLTGAPTLQITWHAGRAATEGSSSVYHDPKMLWADLKRWRRQKLPMGCGTDRSEGGLIGMHAYSILDVRELTNVGVEFFRDRLVQGNLGNVSGFTEYDGKLRLLRVRNPHGQGEWKGEFSDKSNTWQTLLASSGITLPRTMANDGTFWIGYDDFLLGFSNIDVVLAFEGNHAKSFVSNFPPKKSNHRCQRAFEVSLLDPQPGLETKDRVEVFVMGLQKSKRGARQGRADRKKSYKVSDLGILVGDCPLEESGSNSNSSSNNEDSSPFSAFHGQLFGFTRNGHYKLVLDRQKCKQLVVMPISFGHPAATDEFRSFVVRFNADAPLMIRELETTPRMDRVLGGFLMSPKPSRHFVNTRQGQRTVLWKDSRYKVVRIDCLGNSGGIVFVYLCTLPKARTDSSIIESSNNTTMSIVVEATCRGMSCRVAEGLLEHETTEKGKKFQASWRKFKASFVLGTSSSKFKLRSRLLMVLYQSGQDTEMGSIDCKSKSMGHRLGTSNDATPSPGMASTTLEKYWKRKEASRMDDDGDDYQELGVFHPIDMDATAFQQCGSASSESEHQHINEVDFGGQHPIRIHDDSIDEELEKVIALSRQDQVAVGSNSILSEDALLQKALELSRQYTQKDANIATSSNSTFHDLELEDALRRSYQEAVTGGSGTISGISSTHRQEEAAIGEVLDLMGQLENHESFAATVVAVGSNSNEVQSAIDLTAGEAISVHSKTVKNEKKPAAAMVLDLTMEHGNTTKPAIVPIARTKNDSVFILVDSSDDEDTRSGSKRNHQNKVTDDSKVEKDFPSDSKKRSINDDKDTVEKKRKLAAEAALRRLKKRS